MRSCSGLPVCFLRLLFITYSFSCFEILLNILSWWNERARCWLRTLLPPFLHWRKLLSFCYRGFLFLPADNDFMVNLYVLMCAYFVEYWELLPHSFSFCFAQYTALDKHRGDFLSVVLLNYSLRLPNLTEWDIFLVSSIDSLLQRSHSW